MSVVVKSRRGDTMIEVLFAVTIFALVAIVGLTIMNQGASSAQRSLEVTLVRQEIDAQAETLRLMYDEAIAQKGIAGGSSSAAATKWRQLLSNKGKSSVTSWAAMAPGGTCANFSSISRAFVVNAKSAEVASPGGSWRQAPLYSRVLYSSTNPNGIDAVEGIWIEAERHSAEGTIPGYTDFHIRACWYTSGQDLPMTLGTIVRLYEP